MKVYETTIQSDPSINTNNKKELRKQIDKVLQSMLEERLEQVKKAVYNLSEQEQIEFLNAVNTSKSSEKIPLHTSEDTLHKNKSAIIDEEVSAQILSALNDAKQSPDQTVIISTQGTISRKLLEQLEQLVNNDNSNRTILVYTSSSSSIEH